MLLQEKSTCLESMFAWSLDGQVTFLFVSAIDL